MAAQLYETRWHTVQCAGTLRRMSSRPEKDPITPQRLLEEDSFENETFASLDLQGANLSGKEFYRCTFQSAHLQESRWKESKLEACVFRGCDLTRAQLAHTALRDVRFEGSKLMGIDWSVISPNPELAFDECNLRYCSFVGLSMRQTVFARCTALEVNFIDVDLSDADFTGTDLSGSNFRGCTLTRADFQGARGVFIDPATRNRLKATRVPVETAVLVAQTLGMVVAGYGDEAAPRSERKKGR
jgi:fluoroquinolone resistance protein